MHNVTSIAELQDVVADVADDALSSAALVVVSKPWDMSAMSLVNNALRLCDTAVLLYLPKEPLDDAVVNVLQSLDVRILFQPKIKENVPCFVQEKNKKLDITLLLQTVLAVMPLSVFVDEKDIALRQCFTSILATFNNLFTLHYKNLAEDLLTASQKAMREVMQGLPDAVNKGQVEAHILKKLPEGSRVRSLNFFHPETLAPVEFPKLPTLLLVNAQVYEENVMEIFEVKELSWKFWEKS